MENNKVEDVQVSLLNGVIEEKTSNYAQLQEIARNNIQLKSSVSIAKALVGNEEMKEKNLSDFFSHFQKHLLLRNELIGRICEGNKKYSVSMDEYQKKEYSAHTLFVEGQLAFFCKEVRELLSDPLLDRRFFSVPHPYKQNLMVEMKVPMYFHLITRQASEELTKFPFEYSQTSLTSTYCPWINDYKEINVKNPTIVDEFPFSYQYVENNGEKKIEKISFYDQVYSSKGK